MSDQSSVKNKDTEKLLGVLDSKPVFLAPMVRIGTLPFRLLSLRNGADLVWSEEIIDIKLLRTRRIHNDILNTIDYVLEDGTVVFQTCEEERGRNVLQIGSSSPERAAAAVKHILAGDVLAIDLNMGCPKPFSVKGGMGAALLKNKSNAQKILTAMVENSNCPITCKIRLLPSLEDVRELITAAKNCGVVAVTIHGRTPSQDPNHPNDDEAIRKIAQNAPLPVIANGCSLHISSRKDAETFRENTGTVGTMLARCALANPSVFCKDGPRPYTDIVLEFVELASLYDLPTHLVKYTLAQCISNWKAKDKVEQELRQKWLDNSIVSNTFADMLPIFGFSDDFIEDYNKRHHEQMDYWRLRSNNNGVVTIGVDHDQKSFMVGGGNSPKDMLNAFCKRRKLNDPVYETKERDDRLFCSTVSIGDKRYTSGRIEKRKRVSEQTAALAALVYLDAFT